MVNAIIWAAIAIAIAVYVWYVLRERQQIAKHNMSFLEGLHLTGLPIVSFHYKGNIMNFVLDTGSNRCYVDKKSLEKVEAAYQEAEEEILTAGSPAKQFGFATLQLEHKNQTFDLNCTVLDMSETTAEIKSTFGVTIHGLIGTDFFEDYKYILDFNEMVAYSLKKN